MGLGSDSTMGLLWADRKGEANPAGTWVLIVMSPTMEMGASSICTSKVLEALH